MFYYRGASKGISPRGISFRNTTGCSGLPFYRPRYGTVYNNSIHMYNRNSDRNKCRRIYNNNFLSALNYDNKCKVEKRLNTSHTEKEGPLVNFDSNIMPVLCKLADLQNSKKINELRKRGKIYRTNERSVEDNLRTVSNRYHNNSTPTNYQVNEVTCKSDDSLDSQVNTFIAEIPMHDNKANMKVQGQMLEILIDTGATISVISHEVVTRY